MKKYILIFVIASLLGACAGNMNRTKANGETVTITDEHDQKRRAELLAISDDDVYLLVDDRLTKMSLKKIKVIYIHGMTAGAKALGAVLPVLIEAAVVRAAFDVNQPQWGYIGLAAMAGTVYGFAKSSAKSTFRGPLPSEKIAYLRRYCRYPQGLTSAQWQSLLQIYDQKSFEGRM